MTAADLNAHRAAYRLIQADALRRFPTRYPTAAAFNTEVAGWLAPATSTPDVWVHYASAELIDAEESKREAYKAVLNEDGPDYPEPDESDLYAAAVWGRACDDALRYKGTY